MAERRLIATLSIAAGLLAACGPHSPDPAGGAVPTGTASVVRTDIVSRQQLPGTLTFAGSYTLINQSGPGVFTKLTALGAVLTRGQIVYWIDDRPIPLFYGDPEWRRLAVGVADGRDVYALQANLVALGFGAGLQIDNHFDGVTAAAVRRWQASLGLPQTGTVNLGDVVYVPGAIRVAAVRPTVGMSAQPGQPVVEATSPQHAVLVPVDVSRAALVKLGDQVSIALPDGKTSAAGTVTAISPVAVSVAARDGGPNSGPPGATVTITITLTDANAGGSLDQAPVIVAIAYDAHRSVLAVPVMALLAQPGGAYAVEVVDGAHRRLVSVTTGLFDDRGQVEVASPDLREGMSVEVPTA